MKKTLIKSKHLTRLGFSGQILPSRILAVLNKHYASQPPQEMLALLADMLAKPENYAEHEHWGPIAKLLMPAEAVVAEQVLDERVRRPLAIFGEAHIGPAALAQMYTALKLPVSLAGALMPDAHAGYGLPIGGVLATDNAVIPYGVGVDIGCRMCLSVYELPAAMVDTGLDALQKALLDHTVFGAGGESARNRRGDHAILEDARFGELPILKRLVDRAFQQLGTSGAGNHFVEFGTLDVVTGQLGPAVPPGSYLALLSHSGSRGLGATVANHYTQLAMKQSHLPSKAQHLAWLSLDADEGREYWLAMNLAGDYAAACHDVIHRRIAAALGTRPLLRVENHHNFAWREQHQGREMIVHRKGATPAGKGVLGIIPGSMTAPGYLVAGRGVYEALCSASHGAGRQLSRSEAKRSINAKMLRHELSEKGVTLLGGGVDEAPGAYKDIDEVMRAQEQLVDIVGRFQPRVVRMA